jgi:threonine/homoserine/homoserine lactone efflux protein
MGVLLRVFSVLAVLIAAFLIYAVINAAASEGGARAGVAIAYIIGAAVLAWLAVMAWKRAGRAPAAPGGAPQV